MTDEDELEGLRRENAALRELLARVEPRAAKFEVLCSVMKEAVLVLDREGRFVTVESTHGLPSEIRTMLLGSRVQDSFPPQLAAPMLAGIEHALISGEAGTLDLPITLAGREMLLGAMYQRLTAETVLWCLSDVTAERLLQRAEQGLRSFEAVVELTPDGIALLAADGRVVYANQAYRDLTGERESDEGETFFEACPGDHRPVRAALAEALDHEHWTGRLELGIEGTPGVPCQVSLVRLPSVPGRTSDIAVIARDLRPLIEAEAERVALQEQVIEAQRVALRELSTPLLPLAKGVICMPLIGTIDHARAQAMMERLLGGIVAQRAHTAILDVTGIRVADAGVADGLVQVARAAQLLGAQVILTGIGPDVAQTLVDLQTELRGITTLGDLQSGIAYALAGGRMGAAGRARGGR